MEGLFALGSNGSGQLGIGHEEDVSVPKQVIFQDEPPTSPIKQIVAGGNHTVILTESGDVYWAGDSSFGSPEASTGRKSTVFRKYTVQSGSDLHQSEFDKKVSCLAATWDGTIFLLRDPNGKATRVYSDGQTQKSSLGFKGEGITSKLLSDFPPAGTEIVDLVASMQHVVAVLSNGDVYGWGNGRKGQLGSLEHITDENDNRLGLVWAPHKIEGIDFPVVKAACGREFTCLAGDPATGRVRILGSDKYGTRSSVPSSFPTWEQIVAGWSNLYFLKGDGGLSSWGRANEGQLQPESLPKLSVIAVGSEHTVGLTEEGNVISWGWGEHGNCGPQTDEKGHVKGRWNTIASGEHLPEGAKIAFIGAGCATSWIYISSEGIFL